MRSPKVAVDRVLMEAVGTVRAAMGDTALRDASARTVAGNDFVNPVRGASAMGTVARRAALRTTMKSVYVRTVTDGTVMRTVVGNAQLRTMM